MAFTISSILILSVWLLGVFQLKRISYNTAVQHDVPLDSSDDNYHEASLLSVSEAFISCRKDFENTSDFKTFSCFCKDEIALSEKQKEALKKSLYFNFAKFRPYLSSFNGKLNETELFCYILSLMDTDNRHCGELLNMSESSVRSCKARLKGKLEENSLKLLDDKKKQ